MILLVLLIVPIMFWLIPLAKLKEQERNIKKRYIINFTMMVFTVLILCTILISLKTEIRTMLAVLLSISAAWAVVYHLFTKNN